MANSSTKDALHSITKHNNISVSGAADSQILKGFSVGDVLRSSGSDGAYAKAQANNAANAEVLGIITAVPDVNTFTLTVAGYITTAAAVPNETAGSALFLSAATAGALTATEPSTAGQISKPVAIVTTANASMILVAYRGETLSSGYNNWDVNGSELILDADGDTSLTADTDDQIDVKISGADDFRFTANKLDVLSGSTLEINGTLDINGTELILTDDQIDIKISGADDFRFTANNFNILSGSTITVDSGATITNSGTANGFGVTYSTSWVDSSANAILRLTPSTGSADDLTLVAGTNITLTPSGDNLTITAAGGGPTEAVETDMENEGSSNANRYASPEVLKHHPGVAKFWVDINASSGTPVIDGDYNVGSLDDNGTGNFDVNFSVVFDNANYAVVGSTSYSSAYTSFMCEGVQYHTSSYQRIMCIANSGGNAGIDGNGIFVAGFGEQ